MTKIPGKTNIHNTLILISLYFRFMAALDLCTEMIRMAETQRIEEGLEKRICSAFVEHLTDSSLDVQTNAVKSIQSVASIIRESNLIMIAETLAKMVIESGNKEVRDIYSLAI